MGGRLFVLGLYMTGGGAGGGDMIGGGGGDMKLPATNGAWGGKFEAALKGGVDKKEGPSSNEESE